MPTDPVSALVEATDKAAREYERLQAEERRAFERWTKQGEKWRKLTKKRDDAFNLYLAVRMKLAEMKCSRPQ